MKKCSRCKKKKSLNLIILSSGYCKACNRKYQRAYYRKMKRRMKQNHKAWSSKNKVRHRRLQKAWREKNRDRMRFANKKWNKKHPIKRFGAYLKHIFGITHKEYFEILRNQKGRCLGCLKKRSKNEKRFAVDHDHTTGSIRGLLCGGCNTAIGLVKDNPKTLKRLALYIQKSKKEKEVF